MRSNRQPVATSGKGFGLFGDLGGRGFANDRDRLPSGFHEGFIGVTTSAGDAVALAPRSWSRAAGHQSQLVSFVPSATQQHGKLLLPPTLRR
jgi:hypothetical protein